MYTSKLWPLLASGILAAALGLGGCQGQASQPPAQPDAPQQSEPAPQPAAAPTSEASAFDRSAYHDALEGITHYEAGTAGSSLKLYIAAAGLLNFTEACETCDAQTLSEATSDYLSALDDDQLGYFTDNLAAIDTTALAIIQGDDDAKAMLEDAGSPNAYAQYDAERYQTVKAAIDDALETLKAN